MAALTNDIAPNPSSRAIKVLKFSTVAIYLIMATLPNCSHGFELIPNSTKAQQKLLTASLSLSRPLTTRSTYTAIPIPAPVYYVAPYGDDSRSKAQAADPGTPWRTLQKAANNVVAGDTVVVKDGVYAATRSDYLVQFSSVSGTAENPIRFVSENRWGAVLDGQFVAQDVVRIRYSHHITIEGFEIRNGYLRGIRSAFANSHMHIRDNWIHRNAFHAFGDCSRPQGHGILTSYESRHWMFERNLFHNNGKDVSKCSGTINDKFDHGIYAQGAHHVIVNNIFFDQQAGYNIKIDGAKNADGSVYSYPSNQRGFVIMNNTLIQTKKPVEGNALGIALYANNKAEVANGLIMNNAFWGADTSKLYSIHVSGGGWPWPGTEIVNNVTDADHIFRPDRTHQVYILADNVDGTTNPGVRGGSLGMVSPKTKNAVESDFKLTSSALLLIDKGRSTYSDQGRRSIPSVHAPSHDYATLPRPAGTGIDIGAFERRGSD